MVWREGDQPEEGRALDPAASLAIEELEREFEEGEEGEEESEEEEEGEEDVAPSDLAPSDGLLRDHLR